MALLLLSSLFLVLPAQAVQYRGVGGRPAYPRADNPRTDSIFVHILEAGDQQKDGIRVINNDQETKTLLVYPADSTPSSSGGFACKQLLDTQTGVGSWIELEKTEVTLEPGTNEVIDFTITVPENVDVGENNGCILVQEKDDEEVDEDRPAGMHLSFRTGLRVAITVPGELRRELSLAGLTVERRANQPGFLYRAKIENKGNVSTDADIQLVTKNLFGKTIQEHGGEYTILRGDVSELNFEMERPFWGGWYKVTQSVEYDPNPDAEIGTESGERETLTDEPVMYFSMPHRNALLIELAVVLVIVSLIVIVFIVKKRKSWIRKTWIAYEAKEGDDINSLAQKFDVSWKVLAQANRLSAPYTIHPGQDLIVPPGMDMEETEKEEKKESKKTTKPKKEKPKDSEEKKEKQIDSKKNSSKPQKK